MEQIYFGQRIAALRRQNNMTQEAMAQKLGITNQAVSKWESDQCCPDIMQLPQIADLFGITLDALFGRLQEVAPVDTVVGNLPWEDDGCLRAVCFLGRKLLEHEKIGNEKETRKVELKFTGNVEDIHSEFAVNCTDTVINGDVTAGDGVNCGNVGGDVTAGDGVNCGNVSGDVSAGDGVNCGNVNGDASAGDSIHCGDIQGNASAGYELHCTGSIGGNATAGGNIVRQ